MPIRLPCPSCSATLSVKDEFAGRAVKCPKCGGVIPAAQPAAAAPPPPDASPAVPVAPPAAAPPDDFDEPPKPKTGGKITGRPVAASKGADDADDEKPRRKGRDDADDDRPAKRRRRDADDDGPRGKKPEGKSNTGMILLIVGGLLLLCCGGGVGLGWYAVVKVKEQVQKERDRGTATAPIEITATALAKEGRADPAKALEKYSQKWLVVEGTLQGYKSGPMGDSVLLDDGVQCLAEGDEFKRFFDVSKGQRIKLKGKSFGGPLLSEGTLEWTGPDPSIQVTAEVLINDYKDRAAGDAKYKNKEVTITKARITDDPLDEVVLVSTQEITSQKKILADTIGLRQKHFPDLKNGKQVTVKGTCKGDKKGNILVGDARIIP